MSKKKSITKNYIYNVSYQVLALITPLITTPYLSRVLEADGIGIYSFTAAVVSYFNMFAALGTLTYGNREISYLQDDRKARSQVFWEIELLSLLTTGICAIVYILFVLFGAGDNQLFFAIQIFTLLTVGVDVVWFFQGMEEFGKIVLRNLIFKIINIAYIFIVVQTKEDLMFHIGGNVILTFLSHLSLWVYLPKYVDAPEWKRLRPLRHLKGTFILFVPTVAMSIYTILDKTMIGIFSTAHENGYYEQALNLSKTVLTLVTSLGAVMIPRMGYHYNRGEHDEMKKLVYQSYRFVWFLGIPIAFGLAGVASNIVPWFYGDGFLKLTILLPMLSILIPIIGLSNVTGIQYLVTTKREKLLTRSLCVGAVTNFFLNLILIPLWSSIGAAIASVTAELVITSVQFYFIRKEISIGKVISSSWKYVLSGGIMLLVLIGLGRVLTSSILHTVIMVACGVLVYFFMLFVVRDDFYIEYIRKMLNKFLKK